MLTPWNTGKAIRICTGRALVGLLLVCCAVTAHGFDVPADSINRYQVLGLVSLRQSAPEAFAVLERAGFESEHEEYADWWQAELTFATGERSEPEGYREVALARNGDRLISIKSVVWRTSNTFDPALEIDTPRRHFGIPVDDPDCRARDRSGSCGVQTGDDSIAYVLQVLAGTQRYELVQVMGEVPQPVGPGPAAEHRDGDLARLTVLPPPGPTNSRMEACSLTGLIAALNPLQPDLDPMIVEMQGSFLRDNPRGRRLAPAHYAESQLMSGRWCTSGFAYYDFQWMADTGAPEFLRRARAAISDQMPGAVRASGLSETQIRALLDGRVLPGVSEAQVQRLMAFVRDLDREAPGFAAVDSRLVFWLFTPNLLTERMGLMGRDQDLNDPADVLVRHGEHFGWPPLANTGNLLVSINPPAEQPSLLGTSFAANDFSFVQPGVRLAVRAGAEPPDLDGYGVTVPETWDAFFNQESGDFVQFDCDGVRLTRFRGSRSTSYGSLSGFLHVSPDWDPADDHLVGRLELSGPGPVRNTRYRIVETGRPACPYETRVEEDYSVTLQNYHGQVTIPNSADLPRIPGTRGRPVRVGPEVP